MRPTATMRRRFLLLASMGIALATPACGARTGLDEDAEDVRCGELKTARWTASPPVTIAERIALAGIAADGRRVLIATEHYFYGVRVRSVSDDLSFVGPEQTVLSGSDDYYKAYITSGFGHRGLVKMSDCRFVPLAADGSAAGPVSPLPGAICVSIKPSSQGFIVLLDEGDGLERVSIDLEGTIVDKKVLVPDFFWGQVAHLDDGSMVIIWTSLFDSPILAGHFSEAGELLSGPHHVGGPSGRKSFASLGSSALLVGGGSVSGVFLRRFDPYGPGGSMSIGEPVTIAHGGSDLFAYWVGVTRTTNGALVAWSDGSEPEGHFFIQPVLPSGALDGDPLVLEAPTRPVLLLERTPIGAMLAYSGDGPVIARSLCSPSASSSP